MTTISELITNLSNLRNTLASCIDANGVAAAQTETLTQLVPKVAQIESIITVSALPSATASCLNKTYSCDGIIWQCKPCGSSYSWYVYNTSDAILDTYDISAEAGTDSVTAYICAAPHSKFYSLYIGGTGRIANCTQAQLPPWGGTYGGKIQHCYFASGVTALGNFLLYRENNLSKVSGMGGITELSGYVFGLGTQFAPIAQFVPEYSFNGFGNGIFTKCSVKYVYIPSSVTDINIEAFRNCTGLTHIYIPDSVTTVRSDGSLGEIVTESPFYGCQSNLKIYCGASSKPSGFGTYWNYYSNTGTLTVKWNYTREQYENEVGI